MAVNKLALLALLAMSPASMAATLSKRVVGGSEATPGEYPYLVGLMDRQRSVRVQCGATLLDSKSVMTAAHCLLNGTEFLGPQHLRIRAGTLSLVSGGIESNVTRYVVHPGYDKETNENDLAILKLVDAIKEDLPNIKYTGIAGLADEGSDPAVNETVIVTGCGGPLISKSSGKVIGVVSHGAEEDCNAPNTYGAYTRVANYLSFIKEHMEQE
ncbi:hypothetical protein CDD80_6412 [Ophiocordyceps camponoti-rufipedis]|uniref:Peptidase S1 domain-containing protein n=1 Tax=Ophiocordyceps camponoti-rufipedis TaxID=2004952 RepID=A0A2C5ZLZ6_9HYPO|nr:hypothetical protein CDD80_6412 [Ophiocordyceps camponoti-rufipedis]